LYCLLVDVNVATSETLRVSFGGSGPTWSTTLDGRLVQQKLKNKIELEAKDVLPNINCMQAAERAVKCRFLSL